MTISVPHSVIHAGKSVASPSLPFLTLVQLNVLLNDKPSTVIDILKLPLSANDVPVLALIVIVVPLLLKVKPVTVGKALIVGVIDVVPLYAKTCVVLVIAVDI